MQAEPNCGAKVGDAGEKDKRDRRPRTADRRRELKNVIDTMTENTIEFSRLSGPRTADVNHEKTLILLEEIKDPRL
ncbi:MAG: hypothetical protein DI535_26330 [Citrobacter freundii]|nr:MAG: hypothetical protein DI535_26330 [Citrobacter freundii]